MYNGTQLRLPWTTWVRARTIGATLTMAGWHSRAMAAASCGVRVLTEPLPNDTPPDDAVPGCTSRLLAPIDWMVLATAFFDPWPMPTMAMTAATPMMMPSVVRAERMTLRLRAFRAVFRVR